MTTGVASASRFNGILFVLSSGNDINKMTPEEVTLLERKVAMYRSLPPPMPIIDALTKYSFSILVILGSLLGCVWEVSLLLGLVGIK
jgi:hypothetical protein